MNRISFSSLSIIISFLFCFAIISTVGTKVYSQPTPTCVCAECNKKCGTGHETTCSSYQKKSKDAVKDMSEKSMSDFVELAGFNAAVENKINLVVSNKNDFAVKYSLEYDIKDKEGTITYTGSDYVLQGKIESLKLFAAVNDAEITRVLLTKAEKVK